MKQFTKRVLCILAMTLSGANALAATDAETVALFKEAGQSASFFSRSYGYAVFPTVAKGGMGIGAAHGKGGVYRNGKLTGSVTLNQLSIGLQLGGQAYSEIIFFEDQRAYDEFVSGNYEVNTGRVIVERFTTLDPHAFPGVLVASHGPFTWGPDPATAVKNSVVLEAVAQMALGSLALNPCLTGLTGSLLNKHFKRKHGPGAYYGQKK